MISRLCDVIIWGAGLVALALLVCFALVNWPVVTGVLLAAAVSVLMLVSIYQIVRSDRLSARLSMPVRDAAATVESVKVLQ
jgi:hypothetical protein